MNANAVVLAAEPRSGTGEREAAQAAAIVALVVGVPSIVATGAALTLFALTAVVLLAPLFAVVLTYVAWHYNRYGDRASAAATSTGAPGSSTSPRPPRQEARGEAEADRGEEARRRRQGEGVIPARVRRVALRCLASSARRSAALRRRDDGSVRLRPGS
jgi:hypothetical protein